MKEEDNEARIGNTCTEAFAHLVLQNNYFYWLYEIKKSGKVMDLVTEYDVANKTRNKKHLVDVVLENIEIDPESSRLLLASLDKDEHDSVKAQREDNTRASASSKRKNSNVAILKDLEEKVDKENNGVSDETRNRKRRKLLKEMKMFTGSKQNVRKAKGWNDEGHRKMVDIAQRIKEDVSAAKYKAFERTVRELYYERNKPKRNREDEEIAVYKPDLSCVWDLEDEEIAVENREAV